MSKSLMFNLSPRSLSQSSVAKTEVKVASATQGTNEKVLINPQMPLKQNAAHLQGRSSYTCCDQDAVNQE